MQYLNDEVATTYIAHFSHDNQLSLDGIQRWYDYAKWVGSR